MTECPYLTPLECAVALSALGIPKVTAAYVRAEIRDGLLRAEIIERPIRPGRCRAKPIIRVYPDDWRAYVTKYWPRFYAQLFPAA